jgi:multidrug efflux pump subunit AcrB
MAESDFRSKGGYPSWGCADPGWCWCSIFLVAIGGIAALLAIEVRELPDVDRPVVSVNAFLPGASPETMDSEVTRLLEGAAARVSGVMNINSSSEENNTRIWIEFRPEIDTDQAASDVREAISRIERDLPDALEQLSVYKADERAGEIMRIAVRSSVHTDEELNRFVEQDIVPRIVSLPGVADASLWGLVSGCCGSSSTHCASPVTDSPSPMWPRCSKPRPWTCQRAASALEISSCWSVLTPR